MTAEPKSRLDKTPAAALDYEIVQEKAAALGRLGRRLERALLALAQFDQDEAEHSTRVCANGEHWSPMPARRFGTSWCSARRAGCATVAR